MERISWEADTKFKKRVKMVAGDSCYLTRYVAKTDAVKWCRERGIFFWTDTFDTIRFASNRDVMVFLLRWQ